MSAADENLAFWEIEGAYALGDTVDVAAIRMRLIAELQRLPKIRLDESGDRIGFRSAGTMQLGSPFNMIDKGVFRIDEGRRTVAYRLSMHRYFSLMGVGIIALCAFMRFFSGTHWLILLCIAPLMFGWLWGVNFLSARRRSTRYLRRLASGGA